MVEEWGIRSPKVPHDTVLAIEHKPMRDPFYAQLLPKRSRGIDEDWAMNLPSHLLNPSDRILPDDHL